MILKAFSASDPSLEHEYRMLRLLHGHPNLFVQLHTAVCFGSARLALEMEYIHDAVMPFYPQSDTELQCYMRSLLHVRLWLSFGDADVQLRRYMFYTMSCISSTEISSRTMCCIGDTMGASNSSTLRVPTWVLLHQQACYPFGAHFADPFAH